MGYHLQRFCVLFILAWGVLGCQDSSQQSSAVFKIGVTSGPHAEILACIQKQAQEQGISFEIVEFQDFILPNRALAEGSLHANTYQHRPFLEAQIQQHHYPFVVLEETIVMPLGFYSKKAIAIESLETHVKTVAIPNDPTNAGRALRLLERAGLIVLKKDVALPSVLDIENNPLQLTIRELEAPQLPRVLDDVDIAVINMDWALLAGLKPESAIFSELMKDMDYVNVFVVRAEDQDNPHLQAIAQLYRSTATQKFISETFKGAVRVPERPAE